MRGKGRYVRFLGQPFRLSASFRKGQFGAEGLQIFVRYCGLQCLGESIASGIRQKAPCEVCNEAVSGIPVSVSVCSCPIDADDKALIFDGPCLKECAPGRGTGLGPVRHIQGEVIGRFPVVPGEDREAQVVADLQEDTAAAEFHFNALLRQL